MPLSRKLIFSNRIAHSSCLKTDIMSGTRSQIFLTNFERIPVISNHTDALIVEHASVWLFNKTVSCTTIWLKNNSINERFIIGSQLTNLVLMLIKLLSTQAVCLGTTGRVIILLLPVWNFAEIRSAPAHPPSQRNSAQPVAADQFRFRPFSKFKLKLRRNQRSKFENSNLN